MYYNNPPITTALFSNAVLITSAISQHCRQLTIFVVEQSLRFHSFTSGGGRVSERPSMNSGDFADCDVRPRFLSVRFSSVHHGTVNLLLSNFSTSF
ncbi:hypothetical protein FHG87_001539 [Trinorchestia longiramus]|nr:hypothetical protein FHG87_001539 [Trinorchestia longiramus]